MPNPTLDRRIWRAVHGPFLGRSAFTLHNASAIMARERKEVKAMPLSAIIISLVGVGIALWLVKNYLPMDRKIKSSINGVVVIFLVIWLLSVFLGIDFFSNIHLWH
ncbi:Thivi_2564 family membrane protein [Novosphingobium sp. KACC 22771]|uniref:Thivi_2564 family membrane protein n=1 Tax=Novosphingobium sp. KACC 22771 TaxID=3025670 RepID=UPI00236625F7|nr:Thivi_2564 family membrane protein [Novosphingobium sp. KACC 22771]WDF72512.1 hypothetical protein PQ467_00270 [Novosphingobium sp. KACC 22771]